MRLRSRVMHRVIYLFFIYIIRLRTNLGGVFSPWLSGLYRFMCRLVHCSSPYSPKFLKYQLSRFRNEAGFPSQWAGFLIRSGGQKIQYFGVTVSKTEKVFWVRMCERQWYTTWKSSKQISPCSSGTTSSTKEVRRPP